MSDDKEDKELDEYVDRVEPTITAWSNRNTIVAAILKTHLADEGELLPHIFMFTVAQWVATHIATEPSKVGRIYQDLEEISREGNDEVQALIVIGFLEGLQGGEPEYVAAREAFTPYLAAEYELVQKG